MAVTFSMTERFAAPIGDVFDALTDTKRYHKWMPNFVSVERIGDGSIGTGSRWRETRKMFGRQSTEEFEVTAYQPPRSIELTVDGTKGTSRRGLFRFRYELEQEREETKLTLHGSIDNMGTIGSLIARVFLSYFKKTVARDHAALRSYVEAKKAA